MRQPTTCGRLQGYLADKKPCTAQRWRAWASTRTETHSHTRTLTHSNTHTLTHSNTHTLPHSHTHTLTLYCAALACLGIYSHYNRGALLVAALLIFALTSGPPPSHHSCLKVDVRLPEKKVFQLPWHEAIITMRKWIPTIMLTTASSVGNHLGPYGIA